MCLYCRSISQSEILRSKLSVDLSSIVHVSERQRVSEDVEEMSAGPLPDDIEVMAPGAELAAVLAGVDRSRLSESDLVVVAQARARQLAYEQAGLWADLVAIADAVGPDPEIGKPDRRWHNPDHSAECEISAALTWTDVTASMQLGLARETIRRLPGLHQAMLSGPLTLTRPR